MTGNKKAAIERGKLLAKLRRMRMGESSPYGHGYDDALFEVAEWVKGSADRATKAPGGLGRKK